MSSRKKSAAHAKPAEAANTRAPAGTHTLRLFNILKANNGCAKIDTLQKEAELVSEQYVSWYIRKLANQIGANVSYDRKSRTYTVHNMNELSPPVPGKRGRKAGSTVVRKKSGNEIQMLLTGVIANFARASEDLKKIQVMVQSQPKQVATQILERLQQEIPELRTH